MENKYIEMGVCKKPHGIKGAFDFHLYNTDDSVLKKGLKLLLRPLTTQSSLKNEGETFTILSISVEKKTICFLEEVTDRNQVEAMVPFSIFMERKDFPKLQEGEVYLSDLEGLNVVDEADQKIGVLKTFYDHGAGTILVIEMLDGEICELPFVDSFFPEVNMEQKFIKMITPEMI